MKKTQLLLISSLSIFLILTGCSGGETSSSETSTSEIISSYASSITSEEVGPKLEKRNLTLENRSTMPLSKDHLSTYFLEEGSVPLLKLDEFLATFNGFFKCANLTKEVKLDQNQITYTYDDTMVHHYLEIDYQADTITFDSNEFFKFIDIMSESEDEDIHLQLAKKDDYGKRQAITFNLKDYGYDLFIDENADLVIPLSLVNLLFMGPNISSIVYNGASYFFYYGYIDDTISNTRNPELEGQDFPKDLVADRNRQLYFLMDHYYGLGDLYELEDTQKYIKDTMGIDLTSLNPSQYENFVKKFFITTLDDPHTSLNGKTYYQVADPNVEDSYLTEILEEDYVEGGHNYNVDVAITYLTDAYKQAFPDADDSTIHYQNDTAFFKFNTFKRGDPSVIYDEQGQMKADAYKYDTYSLFRTVFNDISTHSNIKNVVIDLTSNGGGVITSSLEALGFLTNQDIKAPYLDRIDGVPYIKNYRVDTNHDGNYLDEDAYEQYNYYVLVSPGTFSAANYFASICKDMGIAKIIGASSSGGGTASVGGFSFIDGTNIKYSGSLCMISAKYESEDTYFFSKIEEGIKVESENHVIHSSKFYDYPYLEELITSNFNIK